MNIYLAVPPDLRALSASAISLNNPACFLEITVLITKSTPIISAMAIIRHMTAFCKKPAMMNDINDTAATVSAYGSCVVTWFGW